MASWADIAASFPAGAGPQREAAIVEAVRAGHFVEPTWAQASVTEGDITITFEVMTQPLRIGDESDSVIPMVTAATAQTIADLLDARLPTSKLMDATADSSDCFIDFAGLIGDPADMSTARMVAQSRTIDSFLQTCGAGHLVAPIGKQWIPSARLSHPEQFPKTGKATACNYGGYTSAPAGPGNRQPWPAVSSGNFRVWQPMGFAHDVAHTDYSQLAPQLVGNRVRVKSPAGEVDYPIDEVATNQDLAHLISVEGPINLHYSFLPLCRSLEQGGACAGEPPPPPPGEPPGKPTPQTPPPPQRTHAALVAIGIGAAVLGALYYLLGTDQ